MTAKTETAVFTDACSSHLINELIMIAKTPDATAPIKINDVLLRSIPNKIKVPRPPAPIKAAKVAVPMIKTKAVRIPEIIVGIASGNSTLNNFFMRDIPNASAASSSAGSISVKPR